ncbi:MAG: PDZ domain-containing protein [Lactobacillales bacterium]|jgi:PDZ domain-containing protein|nr:PDZ domain-containing protein [Lactobacillales bacterium]
MKTKRSYKSLAITSLVVVILLALFIPLPYYVESPGSTENLKSFVHVEGKNDTQKGSFNLTTVSVGKSTGLGLLFAKFDPFAEIVSEKELTGGSTQEEYEQIQKYYMTSSSNTAIEQALKLANGKYTMKFMGVYVMDVSKDSDFYGKIGVADTVTGVDGKQFESSKELIDYIKGKKVRDTVTVQYTHGNEKKSSKGKLMKLPETKNPGIGITLIDHTEVESTPEITIDAGQIGGPSAGLMFTLETYATLTGKDLRHGLKIAGTGTIDADGTVGRIGGIDKKVVSASNEGAKIFFAPDDELTKEIKKANPGIKTNYQEAKAAAEKIDTKMKIVPVKTVQDALTYLEKME